ncbi:MAG: hypothetical protein M3P49_13445, partial [Actinomycetota bacterium]|nr:hypothetical protein [Actinomycetota bacterium]
GLGSRKTEWETEGERLSAENRRAHRLRRVYEAIGLALTAHKDGTLVVARGRILPSVTGSDSPVLGRVFAADTPRWSSRGRGCASPLQGHPLD